MKKISSTFTILFIIFSANAQIKKGTNSFGANFEASYYANAVEGSTSSEISLKIQPTFEYFISKNLSLGTFLNYGITKMYGNSSTVPYSFNSEDNIQNFGVGIQLKKYWFLTKKIAFSLSPSLSSFYNEQNGKISSNYGYNDSYNFNNWVHYANGNIGAMYFINKNMAIEAQTTLINYTFKSGRSDYDYTNNFNLSIVPNNLMLGVKFFFGNTQNEIVTD